MASSRAYVLLIMENMYFFNFCNLCLLWIRHHIYWFIVLVFVLPRFIIIFDNIQRNWSCGGSTTPHYNIKVSFLSCYITFITTFLSYLGTVIFVFLWVVFRIRLWLCYTTYLESKVFTINCDMVQKHNLLRKITFFTL